LRSDNQRYLCSNEKNRELFCATIAGLGLTGVILWAEIKLKKVSGPWIDQETIRFSNLDEFFSLSEESEREFDYTVAWVDTLATGTKLGRGLFFRGNHSQLSQPEPKLKEQVKISCEAPRGLLNPVTVRTFNHLYYHKQFKRKSQTTVHYKKFFYPLDSINNWNRLYGKRGFYQYQLVVPFKNDREPIRDLLKRVAESEMASFLAVLKTFGDLESPGMLSFPRPGVTLALDFPNLGERTMKLFESLDEIVRASGGALYPAKDAVMSAKDFQAFYPNWKQFSQHKDPLFLSDFWRRVSKEANDE
jgi:FAD/FMN-containing dehydrogenase